MAERVPFEAANPAGPPPWLGGRPAAPPPAAPAAGGIRLDNPSLTDEARLALLQQRIPALAAGMAGGLPTTGPEPVAVPFEPTPVGAPPPWTGQPPSEPAGAPPPPPARRQGGGGGYGAMPPVDVPYYEGGPDAEIARINQEHDDAVAQLREYNRANPGASDPAADAAHLADLAKQRDQQLAKLALYKQSPAGKAEAYKRQATTMQLMPYQQAQARAGLEEQTALDVGALTSVARADAEAKNDELSEQAKDYNREYEQAMLRYEQAAAEVAKKKIDPSRWYRSRSTGEKVLGIIGGFIGGVSSALNKTSNVVLDQINREVDRDISAQEKDLQNERVGLLAHTTVLGQMRRHYGDMRGAKLAAKKAIYERYGAQMQTLQAQASSGRAKLKAQQLGDAFMGQAKLAEQGLELEAAAKAEAIKVAQANARAHIQQQRARQEALSAAGLGGFQTAGKGDMKNYIQGWGIAQGVNDKRVGELRDMARDLEIGDAELARLIEIADQGVKGTLPWSEAASEFEQRLQLVRAPMKKAIAGAAESPQEASAIDAMIIGKGGRGDWGESQYRTAMGHVSSALKRKREYDRRNTEATMQKNNVMPAEMRMGPSEKDPARPAPYVRYGLPQQAQIQPGVAPGQ